MKPNQEVLVNQQGNANAEATGFSLDEMSWPFIRDVLTDMYPDSKLATVREIFTNARDAHAAVGNPNPVEVSLPSDLSPTYVVKDNGPGMTGDEICYFFTKYGASTKRNTNGQTGMLGLGSKAALTYTTQFTVVGTKNGVRTTAIVVRGDGARVVDTVATTEENGVEVHVPVSDVRSFNAVADKFFSYVEPGTVLVNGAPPKSVFETGKVVDDDGYVVVTDAVDHDTLVMGDVPYAVRGTYSYDRKVSKLLNSGSYVVARVEIGNIDFTPNRDDLRYTTRTNEAIDTVREYVDGRIMAVFEADMAAAPTYHEALKRANKWSDTLRNVHTVEFLGEKIPSSISITGYDWRPAYGGNKQSSRTTAISTEGILMEKSLIVLGTPNRALNREEKDYIEELHPGVDRVYSVHNLKKKVKRADGYAGLVEVVDDDEIPDSLKWLNPERVVAYEDVKPVRVPKPRQPRQKAQKVKYAAWSHLLRTWMDTPLDEIVDDEIVYIVRSDNGYRGEWNKWTREQYRREVTDFMDKRFPDVTIVLLGVQDVERFLKEYPETQTVPEFLQGKLSMIEASLTDEALAYQGYHKVVDYAAKIDDPEAKAIAARITAVRAVEEQLVTRRWILNKADFIPEHFESAQGKSDLPEAIKRFEKKYPLVEWGYRFDNNHLDYVNALYHYNNRPKTATEAIPAGMKQQNNQGEK